MTVIIQDYLKEVEKENSRGIATEHTYRTALKNLIESLDKGIAAVNEPKRDKCGAPDYLISRRDLTLGYIEAKDIGISLNDVEKSAQLKRYLPALENLILTDYLEFRWYVNGEFRQTARAGNLSGNKVRMDQEGSAEVEKMLREFVQHKPQTIRRPKELAKRMANLTHMVRDIIVKAFEQNEASDTLKDWRSAFAQTLMHDLIQPERTGDFADMFAQTIAYGLFSARVMDLTPKTFSRQEAQALIPKSNPFLRNFFYQITGPALDDELFAPFVEDLVSVLGHTDMERVLKDFGVSKKTRDPVFHFYETFLAEYDPKLREQRGVYYTPDPVVSYIVRSVDHILKSKFKCADGLADASKGADCHRVLILDPACGTGTFLYDIIALIRSQFMERNDAGMWPGYVKNSLLPRLFGFELMMAPYAIAHFKLALQLAGRDLLELQEQGWKYIMEDDDRLGIFLTNTLEDMHEMSGLPLFARWIAEETEAANEVKRDLPIMVICGNPPYSGHSENNGPWISDLINDYKFVGGEPLGERNSKWLQDDYVKFIRFAQWRLDQSGSGVLAFISNNGYLDNPTFRGMRWSLMQSFNDIYILNLHGSSKKKETDPIGGKDENVFDIQQGVCIGIFVKQPDSKRKCQIHYADLWGERQNKYDTLDKLDVSKTKWQKVEPEDVQNLFVPQDKERFNEYKLGWKVVDILPINSIGIVTGQDSKTIAFTGEDAASLARRHELSSECITRFLYRPLDVRYATYDQSVVTRPRTDVMRHMKGRTNYGLITTRQTKDSWDSYCTKNICGHKTCSAYDINYVFPLYLYPDSNELNFGESGRKPNLSDKFIKEFGGKLGLKFIPDGRGDLKKTFGPEDVFYYIYAVLHSPTYRTRYADFLKIDFPRIPLTSDKKLFASLVKLGGELSALHLMESPELEKTSLAFPVAGDNVVAKGFPKFIINEASSARHGGSRSVATGSDGAEPSTKDGSDAAALSASGRVYINKTQYFDGVPSNVWNFTIGGYQVCEKWLKDRRERELANDDLQHYKKIVAALGRTIELMQEIDETIPKWPIE
ncbi:MAG: type ISP restriction/modification enzyme [Kiritimatiellia bacterium]